MQTQTTSYLTAVEVADALAQDFGELSRAAQQRLDTCWLITDRAQQEAFDQDIRALQLVTALSTVARHEAGYYEQPLARVPMDVVQVAGLLVAAIEEQAECLARPPRGPLGLLDSRAAVAGAERCRL